MRVLGFYRVHGFDHRIRLVTDQAHPDREGEPLTLFLDGHQVRGHYMAAPADLLPFSALTDIDDGPVIGRTERFEFARCEQAASHRAFTLDGNLDWA